MDNTTRPVTVNNNLKKWAYFWMIGPSIIAAASFGLIHLVNFIGEKFPDPLSPFEGHLSLGFAILVLALAIPYWTGLAMIFPGLIISLIQFRKTDKQVK